MMDGGRFDAAKAFPAKAFQQARREVCSSIALFHASPSRIKEPQSSKANRQNQQTLPGYHILTIDMMELLRSKDTVEI
jgi:DNA repair protein RadC